MQKEVDSSESETRSKYFLLGPCYHLVNDVDAKKKIKTEILKHKRMESEDTEEIIRDIKAEKVEAWFSLKNKNKMKCPGSVARDKNTSEYHQTER